MRQHDALRQTRRPAAVRQKRHVIGGVDGGRRRKCGAIISHQRRQGNGALWQRLFSCSDDDEMLEVGARFRDPLLEGGLGGRQQVGGSDEDFGGRSFELKSQFVGEKSRVGWSDNAT